MAKVANRNNQVGIVLSEMGRNEEALEHFHAGLQIARSVDDLNYISMFMLNIAQVSYDEGLLIEPLIVVDSVIEISHSIRRYTRLYSAYQFKSEILRDMGKFSDALVARDSFLVFRDSSLQQDTRRTIEEMETLYQSERKAAQIRELEQAREIDALRLSSRNLVIGGTVSLAFLLGFTGFIVARNRIQRQRIAREKAAQQMLRAQLNPHFIFNTLAAIQASLLSDQDGLKAATELSRFAKLMRLVLESSAEEQIPLDEEVRLLNTYLSLHQSRKSSNFTFEITYDDAFDPQEVMVPPMLAQPFIENVLVHGFRGLDRPGELLVAYEQHPVGMRILIRDNGIGREAAVLANQGRSSDHRSRGLDITEQRLQHLSSLSKSKAWYEIEDLHHPNGSAAGTEVRIFIPLNDDFRTLT